MSKKIERKQLKEPDRLQVEFYKMADYLAKRKKAIFAIFGSLISLALVVLVVKVFMDYKVDNRRENLAKAHVIYNNENEVVAKQAEVIEKKIADLEEENEAAKDSPEKSATIQQNDGKIAALRDDLSKLEASRDKSSEVYGQFFEKNPDNPEGWVAGLRYVATISKKGEIDKSVQVLETIVDESKDYWIYQVHSKMLLAGLYEDKGDYDNALKQIESVLTVVPVELKPKALLAEGRILMAKKDFDKAKSVFDAIKEGHSDTPEAGQAIALKALIN